MPSGFPIASLPTPIAPIQGKVGIATSVSTAPKATPQKVVQFGLNQLPQPRGVQGRGLPSPSVGTVLPQTRTIPPPALQGLPYATPTVGASFGARAVVAPAVNPVGHPLQNNIGERF